MKKLLLSLTLLVLSATPSFARARMFGWCEQGNQTIQVLGYVSSVNTPVQASYPQCSVTVYVTGSESIQTGTYQSGGSITGTAGQTITLFINGGSGATATATLTSTNAILAGSALVINTGGSAFTGPATTATCGSGTASCSGTVTITTTVAGTLATLYSDNSGDPLTNPFLSNTKGLWYAYADNGRYDVQFSGGTPAAIPNAFTEGDQLLIDPLYDAEFPSVTQGCAFAAAIPATLTITKPWLALNTQTFSCDMLFQSGGSLQPNSGQTLSLATVRAGLYKIFDQSLGGTIGTIKTQAVYPEWWGSLSQACVVANANSLSLSIVTAWTGLTTQTLTCTLNFMQSAVSGTLVSGVPGGIIQPASGQTLTIEYPQASPTQQIFDISLGGVINITVNAGRISAAWFGAIGDGVTNSSAAMAAAMTLVSTPGVGNTQDLVIPSGTYITDTITPIYAGVTIEGYGPNSTIIKSRTGADVFALAATAQTHGLVIKNLGINGNGGASNNGIIGTFSGGGGYFNVLIDNVIINNVGGDCISFATGAFQVDVNHVECSSIHGNGIDLIGEVSSTIRNSYVHTVGNGGIGFICHAHCLLENDNGLDANVNGIWAQVGSNNALNFGYVTFINCNVEFFGSIGIEVVEGWAKFENVNILANNGAANVQAIRYDATYNNGVSEMDAQTNILLGAGSFLNGVAIHAAFTCPPLINFNTSNINTQQCYSESVGGTYNIPTISSVGVAFLVNAAQISELEVPDMYAVHYNSFGPAPTINPSFSFGTGAIIKGFDAAGSVTVGTGSTGTVGQIIWSGTPAYRGIDVSCSVHDQKGVSPIEQSTVNISAAAGGLSTVSWVGGTLFNTSWNTGMPIVISIGGTTGVLNNQVISNVSSTTSMTITPGVGGGSTNSTLIMPSRDINMTWVAAPNVLNIYSIGFAFITGDVIKWKCTGF